jgi:hypothetical protein
MFRAKVAPPAARLKRYTDFLISKSQEFGAVDFDYVEIPYDHYVVDDWPDRRTHVYDSRRSKSSSPMGRRAGCLLRNDVGFDAARGRDAQMLYCDPASRRPPRSGREDSVPDASYPEPPYSNSFPDNFTLTDYEWPPRQVGAVVRATFRERHQFLPLPLGENSN